MSNRTLAALAAATLTALAVAAWQILFGAGGDR